MKFTAPGSKKGESPDKVDIYAASPASSTDSGWAVSQVFGLDMSNSTSSSVELPAGQYFAKWGNSTLSFQVAAQTGQQMILTGSSTGSVLDLLPLGLEFPGKGRVLMFCRMLNGANESISLILKAGKPAQAEPVFIIAGLGFLAIAIAAAAGVILARGRIRNVAGATDTGSATSDQAVAATPKKVTKVRRLLAAPQEGAALGGHFEERSKEYNNP